MADPKKVFAIKIILDDNAAPVVEDSDIGLYNSGSDIASNTGIGTDSIEVDDASVFSAGDLVTIKDDVNSQQERIISVDVGLDLIVIERVTFENYLVSQNARVDGNSYFGWLKNSVTGVTGWKSGLITDKGIGKYSKYIDLKRGGNTAHPGFASVSVINTNKFYNAIDSKDITIRGKVFQVWLFEDSTPSLEWSGKCQQPTWNVKKYNIPANGYHNDRDSNVTEKITTTLYPNATGDILNKSIPVTVGEISPLFDSDGEIIYNGYSKFQRTANKETRYENVLRFVMNGDNDRMSILDGLDHGLTTFPVTTEPEDSSPNREIYFDTLGGGSSGQKDIEISLAAGEMFESGDEVVLIAGASEQTNTIDSIAFGSVATLTMVDDLDFTMSDTTDYVSYRKELSESSLIYPIKLGAGVHQNFKFYEDDDTLIDDRPIDFSTLNGRFLKVIDGDGAVSFRKIKAAVAVPYPLTSEQGIADPSRIFIRVFDYYNEIIRGNLDATADGNAWVKIIDIDSEFTADTQPCKDFIDSEATPGVLTSNLELYSHDRDRKVTVSGDAETVPVNEQPIQFFRLPEYAYNIQSGSDNRIIEIDVKLFKALDQMDSFLILPAKGLEDIDTPVLSEIDESDYDYVEDGLYKKAISGAGSDSGKLTDITIDKTTKSNAYDRDYSTYYEYKATIGTGAAGSGAGHTLWFIAQDISLPSFPKRFKYDNVYLGIHYERANTNDTNSPFSAPPRFQSYWRRFIGTPTEIVIFDDIKRTETVPGFPDIPESFSVIDDLPDFYFLPENDTNNKNFYLNRDDSVSQSQFMSGFNLFEVANINTEDLYNSMNRVAVGFRSSQTTSPAEKTITTIRIYDLSFIFRKSISVKNEIYTPFRGRIFNDTWEGRKTAADLITSPVDIQEMWERYSTWADKSIIPDDNWSTGNGWGKGYASGARIKTGATGRGSYDDLTDSRFTAIKSYMAAGQSLGFNNNYTLKLKKTICKDFFLASWYDKTGFSNIATFTKPKSGEVVPTITNILTLSDIVDRSKIKVVDPDVKSIYPEPFFNFNINFATGERESRIAVTNSDQLVYDEGYVEGMTGIKAETLWNRCHTNWLRCGHLEPPPKDFTDKVWMNGANAQIMAEDNIQKWADWMGNSTIFLNAHFNKVRDWEESTEFIIQLPHQTNDLQVRCVLEKKTVDPNSPHRVDLEAILFNEDLPYGVSLKDTFINFGNDDDWVDKSAPYGNDSDKVDNH